MHFALFDDIYKVFVILSVIFTEVKQTFIDFKPNFCRKTKTAVVIENECTLFSKEAKATDLDVEI